MACPADNGWTVNVPLSDLLKLVEHSQYTAQLEAQNEQLRKELTALGAMYREMMALLADIRRNQNKK